MGNSCGTCKHEEVSTYESPCKECGGMRICWEEKPKISCVDCVNEATPCPTKK